MNMNQFVLFALGIVCFGVLQSCNQDSEGACDDVPAVVPDIAFIKFDEQLVGCKSVGEVATLLDKHTLYKQLFLESRKFPHDSTLAGRLFQLVNNPAFDTLRMETNGAFGDQRELEKEFELAIAKLKEHYPDARVPKIYTTLTGLGKEMYLSDSLIIISLDYYAGQGATYRPVNIADYILRRYEKEYVVPLVISYLSNAYNKVNPKENSLLGEMIDYGKTYYFNTQILPCKSDTIITGFTTKELEKVEANQEVIWAHFIDRQLLYETNHFVKNKYMGERPNVYEIGDDCPGRVGRWVGLEIVRAFMRRNPEVGLQELMNMTDANKIFAQSKFKPKNRR